MIFQTIKKFCRKHATKGLTTIGFLGMGLSCYFTARAWEECKERINQRKEELEKDKLTVKETVAVCWKPFVLPFLTFSTSAGCILLAEKIFIKKNAELVALYKASETALAEFKSETRKEVGEETFKKIQEKATENQMAKDLTYDRKTYLDNERDLYYDGTYGGYFYATELEVYKAFEEMRDDLKWAKNTSLGRDDYKEYVPLGNLYYRLHHEPIEIADDYGYPVEDYTHNGFDYTISAEYKQAPNGKKALVIYYDKAVPIS